MNIGTLKHRWLTLGVWLLSVAILASCGTSKKVTKRAPGEVNQPGSVVPNTNFELANVDFRAFSGKARAKIRMGKSTNDATLNIRIKKNEQIWISATAMLGIEAARVLIRPDSVFVVNRLHGEYTAESMEYMKKLVHPDIDYGLLEDLLLGNINSNILRTDDLQVLQSEEETQLLGQKGDLVFHFGLSENNRPFFTSLSSQVSKRTLEAYYGRFDKGGGKEFPLDFILEFTGVQGAVKVDMSYSKVDFPTEVEMPFKIPVNYKRIQAAP